MRNDAPEHVKRLAKEFRKAPTKAEEKLWSMLRGNRLRGYKFKRQFPIGRYIADFYCSIAKLVVEVDGKIHENIDQKDYDILRENIINANGIRVIRFTNEQVMNDISGTLSIIYKELNKDLNKTS